MNYIRFWCLSSLVLVVDQVSKTWAGRFIGNPHEVFDWDGWLHFRCTYVTNSGASFSMFSDYPEFLTGLAITALLCIWFFRRALEMDRLRTQCIFGVIWGGIAGNLTDRLFRGGEVVDFLDFTFEFISSSNSFLSLIRNFPVFNVADSAIFTGVVLYLIYGFIDARGSKSEDVPDPPDSPDSSGQSA